MLGRTLISEFVVNATFIINHYIMLFNQEKRDNNGGNDKELANKYLQQGLHAIMHKYTHIIKKSSRVRNKPQFLMELKAKNEDYAMRYTNKIMGV